MFGAHLFERRNVEMLLLTHIFQGTDALLGPAKLRLQHLVVFADRLSHSTLPLQLILQSLDVVRVHLTVGQAVRHHVVLGDLTIVWLGA